MSASNGVDPCSPDIRNAPHNFKLGIHGRQQVITLKASHSTQMAWRHFIFKEVIHGRSTQCKSISSGSLLSFPASTSAPACSDPPYGHGVQTGWMSKLSTAPHQISWVFRIDYRFRFGGVELIPIPKSFDWN
ncbi:hypothetical protein AVEN_134027-1 [Araneus ventricosus]|uniref:Uncharacterized protein n=1 Tax=Araneus ventricosus TaxID=182803 RepID=A0A4Y2K4E4_ARAVE|nr:hypothetical protein AVEN_134027-1 [Araneus ventricosus]